MATLKGQILQGCQDKHWNIDRKGRDQGWLRYRWEEQVRKAVKKRGIKWMEMVEEET